MILIEYPADFMDKIFNFGADSHQSGQRAVCSQCLKSYADTPPQSDSDKRNMIDPLEDFLLTYPICSKCQRAEMIMEKSSRIGKLKKSEVEEEKKLSDKQQAKYKSLSSFDLAIWPNGRGKLKNEHGEIIGDKQYYGNKQGYSDILDCIINWTKCGPPEYVWNSNKKNPPHSLIEDISLEKKQEMWTSIVEGTNGISGADKEHAKAIYYKKKKRNKMDRPRIAERDYRASMTSHHSCAESASGDHMELDFHIPIRQLDESPEDYVDRQQTRIFEEKLGFGEWARHKRFFSFDHPKSAMSEIYGVDDPHSGRTGGWWR